MGGCQQFSGAAARSELYLDAELELARGPDDCRDLPGIGDTPG
jgi:hypothetical protein